MPRALFTVRHRCFGEANPGPRSPEPKQASSQRGPGFPSNMSCPHRVRSESMTRRMIPSGSNLSLRESIRSLLAGYPDHGGPQGSKRAMSPLSNQGRMRHRRPHIVNPRNTKAQALASRHFMRKRGKERTGPAKARSHRTCSGADRPRGTQGSLQAGYSGSNPRLRSGWEVKAWMLPSRVKGPRRVRPSIRSPSLNPLRRRKKSSARKNPFRSGRIRNFHSLTSYPLPGSVCPCQQNSFQGVFTSLSRF